METRSSGTEWMHEVPYGFDAMGGLDDIENKTLMDEIIQSGNPAHMRSHLHASTVLQPDTYKDMSKYCVRECVLAQYYETNPVNLSARTVMIFQSGWETHIRWQRIWTNAGIALSIEQPRFHTGHRLQFTPDGVILFKGRPTVCEVKGYNQTKYLSLIKGGLPFEAYNQCQLYMHLFRLKDGSQIRHGLVIVENKNTQDYKLWEVEYASDPSQHVLDRLEQIAAYSQTFEETGDLPDGVCSSLHDARACECSSRDACFNLSRIAIPRSPEGVETVGE